tara:strand:- start:42384 stop:43355 length:972 start_codon:yes stop_codon:yes gene_type:complete
MFRKPRFFSRAKGEQMRDSYTSDAPRSDRADYVGSEGMRHSIRPRRKILLQAEQRDLTQPQADAAPVAAPAVMRAIDSAVADPVGRLMPDTNAPRWHDLPLADIGPNADLFLGDSERDSAAARAFDLLRTRLRQTTLEHGWVNIAVTAPTSGCGNTFTAANLALSLSRVAGSRTLLMDFNLRAPGLAQGLDIDAPGDLADVLRGDVAMGDHLLRVSDTLAVGLNGHAAPTAAEILQDASTAETLTRMRAALRPQIVIYDMPAMLAHDDVSAFLPQLDGVLLVSDGTQTMARHLIECERMLDGQVPLLGVVLNRARPSSIRRYS